jgi:hypothetical protein
MKSKRPLLIFGSLVVISVLAVAYALIFRGLAGMYIHDSSDPVIMEQLDRTLTREQQHFIGLSFDRISGIYSCLLVITNVLWIAGAGYLLKRLRKDDHVA